MSRSPSRPTEDGRTGRLGTLAVQGNGSRDRDSAESGNQGEKEKEDREGSKNKEEGWVLDFGDNDIDEMIYDYRD